MVEDSLCCGGPHLAQLLSSSDGDVRHVRNHDVSAGPEQRCRVVCPGEHTDHEAAACRHPDPEFLAMR